MKRIFTSLLVVVALLTSVSVIAENNDKKEANSKEKTECSKECCKDKKECCKKDGKACEKKEDKASGEKPKDSCCSNKKTGGESKSCGKK